ncbi:hypothetical protein BLOT_002274 [Blomia tropicalis]|nr:hypothetical protein BLOT_002274 [Blomia tropicalis]
MIICSYGGGQMTIGVDGMMLLNESHSIHYDLNKAISSNVGKGKKWMRLNSIGEIMKFFPSEKFHGSRRVSMSIIK